MDVCHPKDIAMKSFFLGPQAENAETVQEITSEVLQHWFEWRKGLYPEDGKAISSEDLRSADFQTARDVFRKNIRDLLKMYESEVPKFSPRYIGHMFSEISLPALFGHIVTLLHNPNNISSEASRAGTQIEKEAIGFLAEMVGFPSTSTCGHFTSGGTVANFEALLRARERLSTWLATGAWAKVQCGENLSVLQSSHMGWENFEQLKSKCFKSHEEFLTQTKDFHIGRSNLLTAGQNLSAAFNTEANAPIVLIPENKHYSWQKGIYLLGLGEDSLWPISLDNQGRLSLHSLIHNLEKALLKDRPIIMVVSVAGTTELGEVDPILQVQRLLHLYEQREGLRIWHHVDAAYGGFFCSLKGLEDSPLGETTMQNFEAISESDSVTLDPHKLGYVPYACGAFLCPDKKDYSVVSFNAPYVEFHEHKDPGPYTLEGSRSATGATATWMTGQCIGFNSAGYGRILARTIALKQELERLMTASSLPLRVVPGTDTNILCFHVAHKGEALSHSNQKTEYIYKMFHPGGDGPFFVSKTTLHLRCYSDLISKFTKSWQAQMDTEALILIRLCLMNPFLKTKESKKDYMAEFLEELERLIKDFSEDTHPHLIK